MKTLRLVVLLVVVGLVVFQNVGCDKMPTNSTSSTEVAVSKEADNSSIACNPDYRDPYDDITIIKTWEYDQVISYRRGGWVGTRNTIYLAIKPRTMSTYRDTYIYSRVDLTSDYQLLFNFEPDGLSFSSSATLVLNYDLLFKYRGFYNNTPLVLKWWNPDTEEWEIIASSERANNHYIWDKGGRKVSFPIDHFSIYLISKD